MMNCPDYPNSDDYTTHELLAAASSSADKLDLSEFDLSDYLLLGDDHRCEEDHSFSSANMTASAEIVAGSCGGLAHYHHDDVAKNDSDMQVMTHKINGGKQNKSSGTGLRVAFRTKSDLLVMDDGFKWRKYGKKSVKSSPNPRNYYRCSSGGCNVKKRVERDVDDASYVMTTYEGVHNHASPSAVCYNYKIDKPVTDNVVPTVWNSQNSSSSHSSPSSQT